MATTVTLRHITKIYGGGNPPQSADNITSEHIAALRDVTLTVRPGEVLGILGPSGCGKTTLLRIAAGLESPTSGDVLYDNVPLAEIPMVERGIGMVFQNYALYPHLPSIDNIGFFLRLRKREAEIPERVRHIAEIMKIELAPILSRKPPTLSGGERQRVAIARCLARDPRVFFFDEPFSNLDAKLRTSARVELKRLLNTYPVTSIYVTHDQIEAMALCDRIAIMHQGEIMQVGTYRHLYDTPANIFVAGFLGSPSINLFQGIVRNRMWRGKSFEWGPIRQDIPDGTRLVLGFRPEHARPDPKGPLFAEIERIEPNYSERTQSIYARLQHEQVTVKWPIEAEYAIGDVIALSVPPQHIHLFDEQLGNRVA